MTARDVIDNLPEALMRDDRILSSRERELLSNVLRHARSYENVPESKVAETIARAIGETVAQRAFALLGTRIVQDLDHQAGSSIELLGGVHLGTGPLPDPTPPSPQQPGPHPPSPSPPTSPNNIAARRRDHGITPFGEPQPPGTYRAKTESVSPFGEPQPPGTYRVATQSVTPFGEPDPPSAYKAKTQSATPFGEPQPPSKVSASCIEGTSVAVAESHEVLPAQCVIFEEFIVPAELERLTRYALEHETDFRVSEVLSPGVTGGKIDHEHRRSRVLSEPGEELNPLLERVRACLPRVLPKLGLAAFPVANEEAQITASNHGDFFHWHSDNAQEEIASREITFVYFFHREPKRFHGGELRIYDSLPYNGTYVPTTNYRGIVPRQNQIVFFRSSLAHEITPVECPSGAFGDSRFTVNGWFHR